MGKEQIKLDRLGEKITTKQGCVATIIKYENAKDIIVKFDDEFNTTTHTSYNHFKDGSVKNPNYKTIYNVGIQGTKYDISEDGYKLTKEYSTWTRMLGRCYSQKYKENHSTYNDARCCKEWHYFEAFYDWLHSQENFDVWKQTRMSSLDKDILVKGNKIYSPETCCLVPQKINLLFVKNDAGRGDLPIGVRAAKETISGEKRYRTNVGNKYKNFDNPEDAFLYYKEQKETLIKESAQEYYNRGEITEACYNAMMAYEVEITD